MIIFKCKMCGGDLHPEENVTTCECEYCGSVQTIPTADNEKKMNLFGRAQRLLRACEFDKAAGVYESIVVEFPEEAEAYWGLVLCKYGIEYVDDPATGKKVPTCHRSSFDSVMEDSNFDQACENADAIARRVYRDEAKAIEELRKGIIEVSGKEAPYDIFICYKETDENGDRTLDSVIAQDIYDALIEKGYRVFFSRVTLEDKLGQEYEPYIFAALNSAKIMLVVGTDYEHYNAVWVKNEWSRFLKLIASGEKKTLIPCYKGIDAYDMPKEFARLQAQDMGKVGAMQDLMRGIEKLLGMGNSKQKQDDDSREAVHKTNTTTIDGLLRRGFVFLEDGDWNHAIEYADRILDIEVENGQAYLVKLMAELQVKVPDDLKNVQTSYETNKQYQKIMKYGDDELKGLVSGYLNVILNGIIEHKTDLEKEKENLAKRISEIPLKSNAEITKINQEYTYTLQVDEQELDAIKSEIRRLEANYSSLGIFKGKEKKQVQGHIDIATNKLNDVRSRISKHKLDLQLRIAMEQKRCEESISQAKKRIAEIDKELYKINTPTNVYANASANSTKSNSVEDYIRTHFSRERMLVAIKYYREHTGNNCSMTEAKAAVERILLPR
ncbi:MAG: TIR domain-containing protein [Parasporobacterium sp.]|nr:TIR domain-containing protein [Parasporobacterium sp.]